mgnify:CR=1 FL=1
MSLWTRLGFGSRPASLPRAAFQSDSGGVSITTSQQLEAWLRTGGDSLTGEAVTPETAMRVAAVFGCVRLISGAVATLPIDIKRRVNDRTREDAADHPLWAIFRRRPNGWMKPAAFKRMLQAHVLLRGNAYARIVRGVRGDVQALLPLHPDRVKVEQLADLSLRYAYSRPGGGTVVFRQDEILHLMGLSFDGITGVSVLTYARESIGLALATARHGATFFKNGTQVGSKLRVPKKVGKEGLEFLKSSLEAFRAGGDRAQKTIILEEDADFQNLAMSQEDAQFIETIKASRTEIAMFFGVPPHMLGDTDKSTSWGSGIEQQSLGFVAYTLEDWLTTWEEAIGGDLLGPRETDLYARFNRAALVRGDIKTRWGAYVSALQWSVLNPNEVRALEDMNPRDGGDVYHQPPNTAGGVPAKETTGDPTHVDPQPAAD